MRFPIRIFICYDHAEDWLVRELESVLPIGVCDLWYYRKLLPGQDGIGDLLRVLGQCVVVIYIASFDSTRSEQCRWELERAVEMGLPVIPVISCKDVPLPEFLRNRQWADFSSGLTMESVTGLLGGLMSAASRTLSTSDQVETQSKNRNDAVSQNDIPTEASAVPVAHHFFQKAMKHYELKEYESALDKLDDVLFLDHDYIDAKELRRLVIRRIRRQGGVNAGK